MDMRASTVVLATLVVVVLYLSWRVVSPFLEPIFFALVLAYAAYPLHERLSRRIGANYSALALSIGFFGLGVFVAFELAMIFVNLLNSIYSSVVSSFNWLLGLPLPSEVMGFLEGFRDQLIPRLSQYISSQAFSLPRYLLQLLVFFFAFYYTLAYWEGISREIRALMPRKHRELGEEIMERVNKTLSALVRAWLLLNVAKGILMALGFVAFGVSDIYTAIVAGFLTFLFSFVPLFEGWMIWAAGALYLALNGSYFRAIGIAVYGFVLVSPLPDYTVRPMLVARDTDLDETLVFIGMIGGSLAMGLKGLIVGPIVLNLLLVLLKEWKRVIETRVS